jgi:anti-anti-sigma factor
MTASSTLRNPVWEGGLLTAFLDLATAPHAADSTDVPHRLVAHAVDLLDITAAGVVATDGHGEPRLLACSNARARQVGLSQFQTAGNGPCLDCFRTGSPVTAANLARPRYTRRWPGFATQARLQGFRTVQALPMTTPTQTVGVLSLFRVATTPLSAQDLALGQALADIAAVTILRQRALTRCQGLVEQRRAALDEQITIERANGVLACLGDISPDQAFARLRDYARGHDRGLAELAGTVITDHDQAAEVLADPSSHGDRPMVVRVTGEIDVATTPELTRRLTAACRHVHPPGPLVIDLSEASFLAAAGLGALTRTLTRCRRRGITLHVVASTRAVLRPLEITGLVEDLGVVPAIRHVLDRSAHGRG